MRSISIYFLLVLITSCSTKQVKHISTNQCGEPLLRSRLSSSLKDVVSYNDLNSGLRALSKANLEMEKYALGELSETELKLLKKAMSLKQYIVHRIPFDKFENVLLIESLMSPSIATKKNFQLKGIITPPMEDELFGGHQCVFMTLGPPKGRENYGEIAIYFKDQIRNSAWATPWSGWYFVKEHRSINTDKVSKLYGSKLRNIINSNEQRAYSQELYTGNNFSEAFAFAIIENIRKMNINKSSKDNLINDLIKIKDDKLFWNEIDNKRLGYFEVKYPEKIDFDMIEYIEVPAKYRDKLTQNPNYMKWKNLLKFI